MICGNADATRQPERTPAPWLMIKAPGVAATPLAPRIASAKIYASAAETSVLSDSAASDVFAVPKMLQSSGRDAFSGPAETVTPSLSWAAARQWHGVQCTVFLQYISAPPPPPPRRPPGHPTHQPATWPHRPITKLCRRFSACHPPLSVVCTSTVEVFSVPILC